MKANPDYRKFSPKILAPPFQKLNAVGEKGVCMLGDREYGA